MIPSSEPQTQESAWFCLTPGRWAHRSILPYLCANGGLVENSSEPGVWSLRCWASFCCHLFRGTWAQLFLSQGLSVLIWEMEIIMPLFSLHGDEPDSPADFHVEGSLTPSSSLRPPKVAHLLHEAAQGLPFGVGGSAAVRGGHASQGPFFHLPLSTAPTSADLQLCLLLTSAPTCLWWEKRPLWETGLLNLSQGGPPSCAVEAGLVNTRAGTSGEGVGNLKAMPAPGDQPLSPATPNHDQISSPILGTSGWFPELFSLSYQ